MKRSKLLGQDHDLTCAKAESHTAVPHADGRGGHVTHRARPGGRVAARVARMCQQSRPGPGQGTVAPSAVEPCFNSKSSVSARPTTACMVPVYGARPGSGARPPEEAVLKIADARSGDAR